MKNIFVLALLVTIQNVFQARSVAQGVPDNVNTNAASLDYTVVARAANSRVWATITSQTNQAGAITIQTNVAYTEVGANLCFQDANGIWSDSDGSLAIVADGAASVNSPLAVHFSGDANTAGGGTVTLTAPDGKVFVSKVYGITLYDPSLGTNVLIAPLQSSQGQLVGNNHIYFPNAFAGLKADLWYTYSIGGLDQDVVLHEAPPSPAACGLNPQTARLQIWTEWFNPPEPRKIAGEDGAITYDAYLDFGSMVMGPGAALFTQGQADPVPVDSGTIYKHWQQTQQRDWLIEEIPYPVIANVLQALPLHASVGKPGRSLYKDIAASQPLRPKAGAGRGSPVQVAKSFQRQPGLVLDYSMVSSVPNFTFQDDTTYYVSGNVTMSGTNTTFEGGAVIKYTNNVTLAVNSPVTWLGASYSPVIMTAKDDNSQGGTISGSTGSPGTGYYAATALYFNGSTANTNLNLNHLRVLNANTAVAINGQSNHVVACVQMVNCGNGLAATNTTFSLWNGLMYNVMTNFTGTNSIGDVEHLTVDTASLLNTNQTLNMINCLLVAVTNGGTGISSSNDVYSPSGGTVFQTVGSGAHYLAADSPYVNAGTTTINSTLAVALTQMTTFPPVLLTNNFTANTTLSPQAQRDTDAPDIGWHYDPLDYIWSNLTVNSGVTLNLTNGVAVGVLSSNGVTVNGTLTGQGTPIAMNQLASCAVAQEGPVQNLGLLIGPNGTWQSLNLRFTEMPTLGGGTAFINVADLGYSKGLTVGTVTLRDCQLHAGQVKMFLGGGGNPSKDQFSSMTVNLTNNLFDRCYFVADRAGGNPSSFSLNCYNNLFHGGTFWIYYYLSSADYPPGSYSPPDWYFYDNLFDVPAASFGEQGGDFASGTAWFQDVRNGHNGYINYSDSYTELTNSSGGDVTPGIADYQAGALGSFYYPTNGGQLSSLIHAGNTSTAIQGLYHYTVTTNNVIEGTNIVSIGFHYIALGANGLPLDTNGDGIPDYLEDANGNGVVDSGEINWQVFGDLGLQVWITQPENNSVIP